MRGELIAFVDTNVLVYAVSQDDGEKHQRARHILEKGFTERCYAIGRSWSGAILRGRHRREPFLIYLLPIV